jgi:hypothetical protein
MIQAKSYLEGDTAEAKRCLVHFRSAKPYASLEIVLWLTLQLRATRAAKLL